MKEQFILTLEEERTVDPETAESVLSLWYHFSMLMKPNEERETRETK